MNHLTGEGWPTAKKEISNFQNKFLAEIFIKSDHLDVHIYGCQARHATGFLRRIASTCECLKARMCVAAPKAINN